MSSVYNNSLLNFTLHPIAQKEENAFTFSSL